MDGLPKHPSSACARAPNSQPRSLALGDSSRSRLRFGQVASIFAFEQYFFFSVGFFEVLLRARLARGCLLWCLHDMQKYNDIASPLGPPMRFALLSGI